jgi:hypothetical protein
MLIDRVIHAAELGMGSLQSNQFRASTALHREAPDLTVLLQAIKHDNFTCGNTTAFARELASKCSYMLDTVL